MPELYGWPYWSQLTDWTADGRPDENRYNNCLAECAAMCVSYVTSVELSADYLHDRVKPEGYTGYLYTSDGVTMLSRWGGTPAEDYNANVDDTLSRVCSALDDGRPTILLIRFNDNPDSGHFVAAVGYDDSGLILADPWGGWQRHMTWQDFGGWYKGWAIEVKRRRCLDVGG